MLKIIVMMLLTIGLFSCSESPSNTDQANNKTDKSTKTHILSDQQKLLQKAKDTEKLIHEADQKRRQALKDQGG